MWCRWVWSWVVTCSGASSVLTALVTSWMCMHYKSIGGGMVKPLVAVTACGSLCSQLTHSPWYHVGMYIYLRKIHLGVIHFKMLWNVSIPYPVVNFSPGPYPSIRINIRFHQGQQLYLGRGPQPAITSRQCTIRRGLGNHIIMWCQYQSYQKRLWPWVL